MSIITAIYVPEGIAMSADSRLTGNRETENGDFYNYTVSDNNQKIVLLKTVNVGISSCGDAIIGDKTVVDFLRIFEIKVVQSDDNVESVANKMFSYLKDLNVTNSVLFFIGGYKDDEPHVYYVRSDMIERYNYDKTNNSITYGGCFEGQREAIDKAFGGDNQIQINWYIMPLKDAIEISRFFVEFTIKYQAFENTKVATCGGPIDTLVITRDGAEFIKHKIFNP